MPTLGVGGRRTAATIVAFIVALFGFVASSPNAHAATVRVDSISAECRSDGTYLISWAPPAGGQFTQAITVYKKVNGATSFTKDATLTATVTPTLMTLVVPGNVDGWYRISAAYLNGSTNTEDVVSADMQAPVDGTCRALVEAATETPTVTAKCGPDNDIVTVPTTEGVTYTSTGWVDGKLTVTAEAKAGFKLTGETSWTFTDINEACPVELIAVATGTPTVTAKCGPDNDIITVPTTEGVTYTSTGWVDGKLTVTAEAKAGFKLTGETSWTFTDNNEACPIVDDNSDDNAVGGESDIENVLALTGADPAPLMGVASALVVAGSALLLARRRHHPSSN